MDLTLEEVATLLNVSSRTVEDWLKLGKIPSYRMGEGIPVRFSRTEIEAWVLKETPIVDLEEKKIGTQQFSLMRALNRGRILADVEGDTKEEVIENAVAHFAADMQLDPYVLKDLLMDREALHPTALGHGIAVPHTREIVLEAPVDFVFIVFPKNPIPFGALDKEDVHTLFFLFASQDRRHLHLLAKIAHLCSHEKTRAFLKTKPKKGACLEYVKEWEQNHA